MRNLSTGWIVYLYPSYTAHTALAVHQHIHYCRRALSALKQNLWPRIIFYLVQATGQCPVIWPIPFGLTGRHIFRNHVVVPLLKFIMRACKWPMLPTAQLHLNFRLHEDPAILTKYVVYVSRRLRYL